MDINLQQVRDQLDFSERAIQNMRSAVSQNDMRDSWENYLMRFSRAIGKLISLANKCPEGREFGGRLKNASMKADPGLTYLREARNADDHGIEQPTAEYKKPVLNLLGNVFHIEEGSSIEDSQLVINGVDYGTVNAHLEDGKADITSGRPIEHSVVPSKLELRDAINPEKKIVVSPPTSVFGLDVIQGDAINLAEQSLMGLRSKVLELEALI